LQALLNNHRFLTERASSGNGDLYEMMMYLLVILISSVIMIVWLKRKGRKSGKRK
jgi:hypothetical protein